MTDGYAQFLRDFSGYVRGERKDMRTLAEESFLAEARVQDLLDEHGFPVQRAPEGASDDDTRHLYRGRY